MNSGPGHGAGWKALGNTLQGLGRLTEAEASYQRAIELDPDHHDAHNNLGNTVRAAGRLAEAEASYRRAIELAPDRYEAHHNLGSVLQQAGRMPEAEAPYRRVVELQPALHTAHHVLASVLQVLGRLPEAEAGYRRALGLRPDFRQGHCDLGVVEEALGRLPEAEASYRRALELDPDHYAAHFNLGRVLHSLGRPSEADADYRRAIALKPDLFEAYYNRGNTLKALGRVPDAIASYRRAVELNPGFHEAHSNLVFTLDMLEGCGVEEHQRERRRWYAQHGKRYAQSIPAHANLPDPERRLRVGYVSADFHRHSASYIFSPVICAHEQSAFEVFCYSGGRIEDEVTARLRQCAQGWRATQGVSDDALAAQIRDDRIDILVDLSGHSAGNRLTVFARKPAPVQVTAWGHANGTGLATMDYFLADAVSVPQDERRLYAEEVFDLPCIVCYEPPEYVPEVGPLPALGGEPFTFGCVNRIEKISDGALALWGRIMAQLPAARLLVKGGGFEECRFRENFLSRLRSVGIAAERVILLGTTPHAEHLKIYHQVDLGLDPFPHGGGISTAEALWMGVPVVALNGATVPGRVSAAMLAALQMHEWIAHGDEQYVRIALEAARDLPRLARVRAQLRTRLAESDFGDVQRYTRAVERAYRSMWRRWCAGRTANPGAEAEARLRRATELDPGFHEAHFNLACFLQGFGRHTEADVHYRRAIELKPDSHEGHNNLGNVLESLGRLSEAEANYRHAIALKPDLYQAHFNLGNALNSLRRNPEAEESLRCAIELRPDCHEAYDSLGTLLRSLGRAEAETCYRRALEIEPGYATSYNNLAVVLQTLGRASEAEACCRRTIELAPDFDGGYNNRGRALRALGRLSAAETSYRRALELKPDSQEVHSNLLFLMAYCGLGTPEDYLAQARQLEIASIPQEARAAARTKSFVRRGRGGRALRIGYVSGDLGSHVVSMNMQSVLEAHDHSRVEVFAYSTSGIRGAATDRIRQTVDHWHSLLELSDQAAVELIAGHQIDVLVDLSGHTAHNRQGVFARRAAPVQCHYLGYFASTGNSQMDYWIGDSALIPPEHESHFVEQVWRVPRVWVSYTPPERSPDPVWQPGVDGRVCLGSFNEFNKLTERTVALWAEVLRRVPNAHLLLKTKLLGDAANRGSILAAFERHGIAADRIELLGLIADPAGHLSLYCRVDVALDPVGGITGGITTSEALWMGTPVVTLAGARAGERLSAAILAGIGHAQWVARDEDAYLEKVAQLAADPALRRGLRHSLRSTMRESAFCDAAGMARALEDAYESMFDRWAAKTPAAAERR